MAMSPEIGARTAPPDGEAPAANMYDAVPYSVDAYPQTRPDRMAAIAAFFGLQAPPPRRCRVLELGCASGGNLVPLALTSPDSEFVGIDLSSRQVAEGQAVVRELGLGNVELKHMSILDVAEDFGVFDYILAHGVYSWVPSEVQDKILEICRRNLAANGMAYVSYNTFPGWHARGAIREMLCYHTERFSEPAERIREARNLLTFLVQFVRRGDGYGALLCEELDVLARTPDSYLMHEHLEDCNEPVYFHQFAERAAAKGLQYLGEAHVGTMVAGRFGADAEKTLRQISPDLLHMEQYMDFLRNRTFRQTLLCHDAVALDYTLRPEAVKSFYIAAPIKPVSEDLDVRSNQTAEFHGGNGATLATRDPLMKAAMAHLSKMWPMPVSFANLLAAGRARLGDSASTPSDGADMLALRLLNCHVSGVVEFSAAAPAFRIDVSERPVASPYARLRARTDGRVTNLLLETVPMGEPSRLVLQNLDGSRDRGSLIDLLAFWLENASASAGGNMEAGGEPALSGAREVKERAARFVEKALDGFARAALLIG